MSYTKQSDIPASAGETVVKLDDTGDFVAVMCSVSRDPRSNDVIFIPAARWIAEDGSQHLDASGRAVSTTMSSVPGAAVVAKLTSSVIVREHLMLVLGEPLTPDAENPGLTILPWGTAMVAQVSIRSAIAAATVSGPVAADVL